MHRLHIVDINNDANAKANTDAENDPYVTPAY